MTEASSLELFRQSPEVVAAHQRPSAFPARPHPVPVRVRRLQPDLPVQPGVELRTAVRRRRRRQQKHRRCRRRSDRQSRAQLGRRRYVSGAASRPLRLRRLPARHFRATRLRARAHPHPGIIWPVDRAETVLRRPGREGPAAVHGGRVLLAETDDHPPR